MGCGGEEMMINKTHMCKLCDYKVVYGCDCLSNTWSQKGVGEPRILQCAILTKSKSNI